MDGVFCGAGRPTEASASEAERDGTMKKLDGRWRTESEGTAVQQGPVNRA